MIKCVNNHSKHNNLTIVVCVCYHHQQELRSYRCKVLYTTERCMGSLHPRLMFTCFLVVSSIICIKKIIANGKNHNTKTSVKLVFITHCFLHCTSSDTEHFLCCVSVDVEPVSSLKLNLCKWNVQVLRHAYAIIWHQKSSFLM
jgi:hypothetical protein